MIQRCGFRLAPPRFSAVIQVLQQLLTVMAILGTVTFIVQLGLDGGWQPKKRIDMMDR